MIILIILSLATSSFAAWLTFTLIQRPAVTPTRSSALVSLGGFLMLYIMNHLYSLDIYYYSELLFGASFVGMCSYKVVKERIVIIGGLFFGLLYALLYPYFIGVGGTLGFLAFISIITVLAVSGRLNVKRS